MTQHDYSEFKEKPTDDQIATLGLLADKLDAADAELEALAVKVKEISERRRGIAENDLPQLLQDLGLKQVVTARGLIVELREEVRASFPKDPVKREEAFTWLHENKHDGLIKQKFVIEFGREQEAWAEKFQRDLAKRKNPLNVERKKDLNHQSMLAFLRERLREGEDVPLPLFGAFVQKFAKVKRQ